MRTLLIGSDFMYDKDGNLKPIEINTAVGWDSPTQKVEDDIDCLDLTSLYQFIETNGFTSIHYVGEIVYFHKTLEAHYSGSSVTYEFHTIGGYAITIPFIEDNDETLIIRSAYDTTALVDDTYCRDKVEFMKLIQSQSFGSQFAYKDESNQIVSNITTINDNGVHPNFILKSRYPGYNKEVYPKFFKVTTQEELNTILGNVTSDYFLMENYCNTTNNFGGHVKVIRSFNILYPTTLESIQIGQSTKFNENIIFSDVEYDSVTYMLNSEYRDSYITSANNGGLPKLLDTDMVEMADGTFKTALELVDNDIIKTIDIPNPNGLDTSNYIKDYGITYDTLITGTTYSTNRILHKKQINKLSFINVLTFDDQSTWEDTYSSYYLIDRSGIIQFERLNSMNPNDVVLMLDSTDNNVDFVRKTVLTNVQSKRIFSGWQFEVENAHVFLTKTTSTNNQSYVSIEHNPPLGCPVCTGASPSPYCTKVAPKCSADYECVTWDSYCP
jgi:hypothetical protein